MNIWILGIIVFFARVIDVSMGTMRTISIVQGRTKIAFILGFFEISMWLLVLSAVLQKIMHNPYLGIFYALGFSTGNVVGILLERRLAMGYTNLRIITSTSGMRIAEKLRGEGYPVTTFEGEGKDGKVTEVYIACERKSLTKILNIVKEIEPDAFYITEQAGIISKIRRPTMLPPTGWRAIHKKK
jgi:uncharacterized protein YebE (UPF0316 family)